MYRIPDKFEDSKDSKDSMIGFKECVRTLVADQVSRLITDEKMTPQFAVSCTIHDILMNIWAIYHNDIDPGDISSGLYDRLHDQACNWADECLKEVQHA